jgi:hypothetical protein
MLDWGTRPKMAATAAIKTIKVIKPTLIHPFRLIEPDGWWSPKREHPPALYAG